MLCDKMKGIHILSTSPSCCNGKRFSPHFFEVESYVLSALLWRSFNGPIKLYTDAAGLDFLTASGLESLWDSIEVDTLQAIPAAINQQVFWAGAKLFALRAEGAPVAMIDTDLFIWKDISSYCKGKRLVTLHREDLIECYPSKEGLNVAEGYSFKNWMDWTVKPCNTAFAFFLEESFKSFYVDEAIRFMKGNDKPSTYASSQMVFAEQRLLSMCAKYQGIKINTLVEDPYDTNNEVFTHLWGAKGIARNDCKQRKRLEEALLEKIKDLSEDYYKKLCSLRSIDNN